MLTIQANLPTYEDVAFAYGDHPVGHPVWEDTPKSLNDESAKRNATQSYVGRLVPSRELFAFITMVQGC